MTHEITENQSFNTQPPEGGWLKVFDFDSYQVVSTHSRLKAAGTFPSAAKSWYFVSTHSRLKAAAFDVLLSACAYLFQHTAA